MDAGEEREIVIVGGGICGLGTALALHRKGIKSVVLERSESLRASGAAIGVMANGWRALDQLGVGSDLRHTALPIKGARDIWLDRNKQQEVPFTSAEARCLKRSDLITALADELPLGTIRFGCQVLSVEFDHLSSYPILHLHTGNCIKAKVVIGCDGANSVVSNFLELKPTKVFSSCAVRGLTNYPDGHIFAHEFLRTRGGNILLGRIPIDDKLVYWFVTHPLPSNDVKVAQDSEQLLQSTLELVKAFPAEHVEMVEKCDQDSLSLTHLRYRAPWDLLLAKFRRGTVTVAGDAMHVMGPFLGQGGSAGLEDAVVLGRCLAQKLISSVDPITSRSTSGTKISVVKHKIEEAIDEYVKERRMRIVRLSVQSYLTGLLLIQNPSVMVRFLGIMVMVVFFNDPTAHIKYDCGHL